MRGAWKVVNWMRDKSNVLCKGSSVWISLKEIPSRAKARIHEEHFIYGLKPVPFTILNHRNSVCMDGTIRIYEKE